MFEAVGFQGVVWRKPHVTFLDFPPFGLNFTSHGPASLAGYRRTGSEPSSRPLRAPRTLKTQALTLNTKKRTSLNSDILVLQPKLLHPESQILVLPTVAGARLWVAEATTGDPKFYTVSSVQG